MEQIRLKLNEMQKKLDVSGPTVNTNTKTNTKATQVKPAVVIKPIDVSRNNSNHSNKIDQQTIKLTI